MLIYVNLCKKCNYEVEIVVDWKIGGHQVDTLCDWFRCRYFALVAASITGTVTMAMTVSAAAAASRIHMMLVIMMSYLGDRFENNRAHKHTKIRAHNMHETNHGRVLSVVDDNIGVLENEKRLREYKQKRAKDFDSRENEI